MSKDTVELELVLKRLADLQKVPKALGDSTSAASALQKQFADINAQIMVLAQNANALGKTFGSIVKGSKNLEVAKIARDRQVTPSSSVNQLDKQIAAQRIRVSEQLLNNERLSGAAKKSNLATVEKEVQALKALMVQKEQILANEKQIEASNKRQLTLQEQLSRSVSSYRVARLAGQSGTVTTIQDQLNRAGLLIDRQRLIVEQARVTANGKYTAELATQEGRLSKLLSFQNQLKVDQRQQPRVIQPVDLASLFKIQAELMVNYTLMNQLFALFRFGTTYVLEYDKALKDLQAITQTTNTEAAELSKTFVEVSESTRFSAVEIAKAAVVMGQAGFSAAQINDSIQSVVLLATATGSDLASSVDIATSAITVFNLNAGEMGHVADVMTGALNLSKLTMDKLALSIQYAGNTAAESGLNLEEFVAVVGGIANAGIKSGSTIGTGLQQLLVELQKPTTKLVNQLKQVGLTMADIDVKGKGFINVMEDLAAAGFNSANALAAFDLRGAKAYLSISRNIDAIKDMKSQIVLSNAAAEANARQMESLANSTDRLRNVIGATILEMSGPMEKTLLVITNALSEMLITLNKTSGILPIVGTLFGSLVSAAVVVRVGGLALQLLGLNQILKNTVGAFIAARVAAIGFGGAMTFLSRNPIIAVTVALASLVAVIFGANAAMDSLANHGEKSFDELQADADKARGAYEKTVQTMESVGTEIDNLTSKYGRYKNDSAAVKDEVLAMQLRFGELSAKIRTDTITSVDELIAVLRELQGELNKTSIKQLQDSITTASATARGRVAKIADESAHNSRFDGGLYQNSTSSPEANKIIQSLRSQSLANLDLAGIKEYQRKLETVDGIYKTQIAQFSKKAEELIASRKDDSKEQEKINEVRDRMVQVQGALADSTVIYAKKQQEVIANIQDTDPFKKAIEQLDEYNKELSENKEAQAKAEREKDPKAKEAAVKAASAIQKKIEEFWAEYTKGVDNVHVQEIVNQINQNGGPKVDAKQVSTALDQVLGNKAADAASRSKGTGVGTGGGSAMNFYDKYAELTKIKITEIERQVNHSTDLINRKITEIDAIIAESTDLEHGGMSGKVSDATLFDLQSQKKQLQTAAMQEQIRQYDELLPRVKQLVDYEQKLLDKATQAYDKSKGSKGEGEKLKELVRVTRDFNDAKDKQIDLTNKYADAQSKVDAALGNSVVAQKSLADQIGDTIEQYGNQMAKQNDLQLNIRKNVISVMDSASNGFSEFVQNVATGTQSVSGAFRGMAQSIIRSMLDIASRAAASGLMNLLGSVFQSVIGGFSPGNVYAGAPAGAAPIIPVTSVDLPPVTANGGGLVPRRFAKGGGVPGRDSVHGLLRPGEFVLRNSAVDMIGVKNLERINNAGNTRVSDSGNGVASAAAANPSVQLGTPVNVYVVPPDQKPALTKNDVIATISDDIYKGGATIKLIKTVIGGRS